MNEKHLAECLQRLIEAETVLDRIRTDLRGAQEFRDAVFDLLEGTPFGAQADSTYDGLYGRLRAALAAEGEEEPQ
jgi:predicted component of type VI protein secretion system